MVIILEPKPDEFLTISSESLGRALSSVALYSVCRVEPPEELSAETGLPIEPADV
jgi:hypothetical protein